MLATDVMQNTISQEGVHDILLDQCCYGLRSPDADVFTYVRKPTRIITNLPGAETLRVRCPGGHSHTHAIGSIKHEGKYVHRSLLAGRYPPYVMPLYRESGRRSGRSSPALLGNSRITSVYQERLRQGHQSLLNDLGKQDFSSYEELDMKLERWVQA
jgi:hypothetical protein